MCFWADFFLAGYNSTQDRDLIRAKIFSQTDKIYIHKVFNKYMIATILRSITYVS